jgi:cobalt-zinc-cadmium resistance protein CzcA
MVRKLIGWALDSPLVIILLTLALAAYGSYAFFSVNVEAYPDPAPAIIEVIAQFPGGSAEEVERQVTVPLEVTLAGMPGLTHLRSKSLFGLSHLRVQFEYGFPYKDARQEVINRLQFTQPLPPGVTPQLSPQSPTGEIFRYTLKSPQDAAGGDLYTLNDLKALQDWVLEREFRRVPRIIDVSSSGGTVKRFEVQVDPDRLRRYGITLQQVQAALNNANANVGGDYVNQGHVALNVRSFGLFGGGLDPAQSVLGLSDPYVARQKLRAEEARRIREIRSLVLTSINNAPILLEDVVEGGRLRKGDPVGQRGVVVSHLTRLGRVGLTVPLTATAEKPPPLSTRLLDFVLRRESHPVKQQVPVVDPEGNPVWRDEDDKVQCIVLLRKNEDSLPALQDVEKKVAELNKPSSGRMLPGVEIEPYYDRTELIGITTETVRENLLLGMILVTVILLMFLSNVRSALIVAINIPLALLFAFSMLFLRGKSANLLSIGAVDFGIIVDSSVIMVENIYRHLSSGENADKPLKERILLACHEVEGPLFFSTLIMVCAFIPLFTMRGPEGQIFGPMADTYAFALGGALLLALLVAPVLCLLFFRNLKPAEDNFLVRYLKNSYLRQLDRVLRYRWISLLIFTVLIAGTGVFVLPHLGREFMPELEEGNLWIRGTFPLNISLERMAANSRRARAIIQRYPEVESIVSMVGRPDDGTDPTGFYNVEIFVPLKPRKDWPAVIEETGLIRRFREKRSRSKEELIKQMNEELARELVGVDWNFSQNIRDNVMEALSGVKGDNSIKIFGPDLDKLEELADKVKNQLRQSFKVTDEVLTELKKANVPAGVLKNLEALKDQEFDAQKNFETALADLLSKEERKRHQEAILDRSRRGVRGIENVGVFSIKGQTNLEFRIDLEKCKRWGVAAADVNNVIQTALGAKPLTTMIEGEKLFDVSVRWPKDRRGSEMSILDIPVDVSNNQVTPPLTGTGPTPSPLGSSQPPPSGVGSQTDTRNPITSTPRLRLRDLVTPVGKDGSPDPKGQFERPGASTIYREQGNRLIAVKFSVRNRDLAGAVAEAQEKTRELVKAPYRVVWSGEFEEMEKAEARLMLIIPASLALIFVLLYMAFRSWLDAFAVLSNVMALSLGGIWALYLTGTHFSISAAVGFVSIFGVAIMDGLLLVSYFNAMRKQGLPVRESILEGASKRVRPVMMTALTAIFGLLPAAVSTRIGAQTQRPLAIVVVGGMLSTLFLTRYLMPLLYSFYGHREPPSGGGMAH